MQPAWNTGTVGPAWPALEQMSLSHDLMGQSTTQHACAGLTQGEASNNGGDQHGDHLPQARGPQPGVQQQWQQRWQPGSTWPPL